MPSSALSPDADWFARITGFRERAYAETQALLSVEGSELVSRVNGARRGIGTLSLPSLAELRAGCLALPGRRSTLQALAGDVRQLHSRPEFAGALFQVASQFNLLEMPGPGTTPEHGVTGYAHDRTQGPACAIAAGAGTIYRNYLMPVGAGRGQTANRQVDTTAELRQALAQALAVAPSQLWRLRNGYLELAADDLRRIGALLAGVDEAQRERWRGLLRIGWQRDVEVTDLAAGQQRVSQAYCSAVPVSYSRHAAADWQALAGLVLEAAYEASLLAAWQQRAAGGSPKVLLTRLGGGAFGNADAWIDAALLRALQRVEWAGLDIHIVCFGRVDTRSEALVQAWGRGRG